MLRIYLFKRNKEVPDCFLLKVLSSEEEYVGHLFGKVLTTPFKDMVKFVDNPKHAQHMFLPHDYSKLKKESQLYLREAEKFASKHQLKTLISDYGDTHTDVTFKNAIVLRTAKYKNTLNSNEVIIPPFIEDLGTQFGVSHRNKFKIPTVCFHGMVKTSSLKEELSYQAKVLLKKIYSSLGFAKRSEIQGLFFRRKSIRALRQSNVNLDLGQRRYFSAAKSTIKDDPQLVRTQFVEGIKNADLPLVVRGNGNYSLRFFEVLSLGRVPLFIDTDTALPLEKEINYDEFILRVDHREISNLPSIIDKFWSETSEEQYLDMQKRACEAFGQHLRADLFYTNLFQRLKKELVQ